MPEPANLQGGGAKPWWLGLVVVVIGAVWLYGSTQLSQTSVYAGVGPGTAVALVGGALVVLGCVLLAQIGAGMSFEPLEAEDADPDAPVSHTGLALALLASAVPLATMQLLGFPITAGLVFMLVARAFGARRIGLNLIAGVVLGSLVWLAFGALGLGLGAFLPILGG